MNRIRYYLASRILKLGLWVLEPSAVMDMTWNLKKNGKTVSSFSNKRKTK